MHTPSDVTLFGLRFDGDQLKWPPNLGEEPKSFKETSFVSFDVFPFLKDDGRWNELVITEAGELYLELQTLSLEKDSSSTLGYKAEVGNMSLEKLEDFTGEITFEAYIEAGEGSDEDFHVVCSILVIKGKLDGEVKFLHVHGQDASDRRRGLEKMRKDITARINRGSKWWYKFLYRPYKAVVRGVFFCVAFLLQLIASLVLRVSKFMTPIE